MKYVLACNHCGYKSPKMICSTYINWWRKGSGFTPNRVRSKNCPICGKSISHRKGRSSKIDPHVSETWMIGVNKVDLFPDLEPDFEF